MGLIGLYSLGFRVQRNAKMYRVHMKGVRGVPVVKKMVVFSILTKGVKVANVPLHGGKMYLWELFLIGLHRGTAFPL